MKFIFTVIAHSFLSLNGALWPDDLLSRRELNEGSNTTMNCSIIPTVKGTIINTGQSWETGAPVDQNFNIEPDQPILIEPANQATNVSTSPALSVLVSDIDSDNLTVTYYGRKKTTIPPKFTIIGMPDTQYYTSGKNGGSPAIMNAQTQWITAKKDSLNIVYVAQLGDCVEDGDLDETQWQAAEVAMEFIEDSITTNLADGIPYGIAVGNHDQTPFGDADGTTNYYNQYFGESRFSGRGYYGGHYGSNNDNHYQLFSADGMDFIGIYIEYDLSPDATVITWAEDLLQTYGNRRAIIVSHYIIGTGNPGAFATQGQAIYNAFKDNPNVFLFLCGHVPGEGRRSDSFNGNTIHTVLADYQGRTNGGDGWLRIFEFDPENNSISVKTYSPWLDQWETDGDSQFTLSYTMSTEVPFQLLGTDNNVLPGTASVFNWTDMDPNTEYEWFVTVDDGDDITIGPNWTFTSGNHRLSIKAYLEGAFNGTEMNTDITQFIPLSQPYSGLPWDYQGMENVAVIPPNIVDWILVELRDATEANSATASTRIARQAAFIRNNGEIVGLDGSSALSFSNNIANQLYAVIWHRNHLAVLSAQPLENIGGTYIYDFSSGFEKALGGISAQIELNAGIWGMIGGDADANGLMGADDKTQGWMLNAGLKGYLGGDCNFDTQVNNKDKNDIWLPNLGKECQVPE